MYTKSDYEKLIASKVEQYPNVALRFRAGDPVISQHLLAQAQMLALMSQQIEIGGMEPFEKARDTTVLADAALKGVLPRATPAKIKVSVANRSADSEYVLQAGRRLLDVTGRLYEVATPVTAPTQGTVDAELYQRNTVVITHEVQAFEPFYKIHIPEPESGRKVAAIHVSDNNGNVFEYRERFTNVNPGERIYHVETDEKRNNYIRFGYALPEGEPVIGYQPAVGEIIRLVIYETDGDVVPDVGSLFALEYAQTALDPFVEIRMVELLEPGKNPIGITELRDLTRYPAIYDHRAVYLGGYDFLLRRNIGGFNFLSVWNEQVEERAREPSVDHIKKLFVSFSHNGDQDEMKEQIRDTVLFADDSWRFKFVEPVPASLLITVTARVARVHALGAVEEDIRQQLLIKYGLGSIYSERSMDVPPHYEIQALLKGNVVALQDAATDFNVSVSTVTPMLPEHWHYATAESIIVNVEYGNHSIAQWGR